MEVVILMLIMQEGDLMGEGVELGREPGVRAGKARKGRKSKVFRRLNCTT